MPKAYMVSSVGSSGPSAKRLAVSLNRLLAPYRQRDEPTLRIELEWVHRVIAGKRQSGDNHLGRPAWRDRRRQRDSERYGR